MFFLRDDFDEEEPMRWSPCEKMLESNDDTFHELHNETTSRGGTLLRSLPIPVPTHKSKHQLQGYGENFEVRVSQNEDHISNSIDMFDSTFIPLEHSLKDSPERKDSYKSKKWGLTSFVRRSLWRKS